MNFLCIPLYRPGFLVRILLLLSLSLAFFSSCKKSEDASPTTSTQSELVQDLNGYRFEGSISEDDPDRYEFTEVRSLDEYNDSIRVHFTTLSKPDVKPAGYKWHVANAFDGRITRRYKPLDVVMDKKYTFRYTWNHPTFELGVFGIQESYVNFYKPDGTRAGFQVIKPNNSFPYVFTKNFTVFFESQGSVYLFEHGSLTTLNRFVLSSEPSITYASTYLDKEYESNGYVFRANFITSFFNPTLFGNYVGIARGDQTVDTLMLNHYDPTIYINPSSSAFADKVGDTLFLGLVKRRTANISDGQDLSIFRILPGESELKPLFANLNVLGQSQSANFHKGHFYLDGKCLSDGGVWQDVPMPKMKGTYVANLVHYGKKRMYAIAQKDSYTFEIYSREY